MWRLRVVVLFDASVLPLTLAYTLTRPGGGAKRWHKLKEFFAFIFLKALFKFNLKYYTTNFGNITRNTI